ncbi:ATP-grasp fold amidoligase family protein [Hoeflea poritis]|uniref:ATP-grasp fold amidoligase family protein n=1 Tax=Hoeflea poritis TaxID=2993659 RepID=A0ABT4VWB6_9HYPH|nr:ATP-grasp fold amidoligase family protein [Hoeflea poritis]MDA4848347.1 ATP-grasp fold amidoligase family protein [Hoeflea poritis]
MSKYKVLRNRWTSGLSSVLPDAVYLSIRHRLTLGRWPRLSKPTHFNEHILNMMLSREDGELRRMMCDKVAVRGHVAQTVGSQYLSKIYATWDGTGPLPFDELPRAFVAKPSHASGYVRIVRDRQTLNEREFEATCRKWLAVDHEKACREYVYEDVPHRVVFEELLEDPATGEVPSDYKIYVFSGKPRIIEFVTGRFTDHQCHFFDAGWNPLSVIERSYPPAEDTLLHKSRPPQLDLMLDVASKLSKGIKFVRVDLYAIGDRIVFGELTNFPQAGNMQYEPDSFDSILGKYFEAKHAI